MGNCQHYSTEEIVNFIEEQRESFLNDLRRLVEIDSNSYDKEGVNKVNNRLEMHLKEIGFDVQRFSHQKFGDDLVAVLEGDGSKHILLLGHSDTVFPRGTAAERPMIMQENKVMGPGVCDMKGGLLTGIFAVAALRHIKFNDFKRITFLCVSDEEIDEPHSDELIRKMSRQVDVALTLEAARANGDIVVSRKGVRWFTIEAFGKASHAGVEPEKGRNAILALSKQIVAIDKLNGFRPDVTLNVGVIEGGSAPNVVPDYAHMRVDLRAFTEEDLQVSINAMKEKLGKETVPGVRVTVKQEGPGDPVMPRTLQVMELEKLAQEAACELGFEVKGAQTGGGSDANLVAAEGVPVLDGLGPIGGLDHSPDEYIELSSIVPRTALLTKLIIAIAERING